MNIEERIAELDEKCNALECQLQEQEKFITNDIKIWFGNFEKSIKEIAKSVSSLDT